MATHRTAEVTWKGSLIEGSGTIDSTTSGVLAPLPVTWTSRAEDPQGRTSPEDLLAAAHASCFAMALSAALADAGYAPTSSHLGDRDLRPRDRNHEERANGARPRPED